MEGSSTERKVLEEKLQYFAQAKQFPKAEELAPLVKSCTALLMQENPLVRPLDEQGLSGGLILLNNQLPTLVMPDLHGRRDFVYHLLQSQWKDESVLEALCNGEIQLICVGDGFHGEKRVAQRWKKAFEEYQRKFRRSPAMDEEMTESLGVMAMVMLLKLSCPDNFHFLKGNHENIRNEYSPANRPFGKFAFEGEMVKVWTEKKMGGVFLEDYGTFEDNLPLLVQGDRFLISHAEPAFFYPRGEVISYRSNPSMVFDFTWTANDDAQEDAVKDMLEHYLPDIPLEDKVYFGGHRPVRGLYNRRAQGLYIQFHNPEKEVIIVLEPETAIDPDNVIMEL